MATTETEFLNQTRPLAKALIDFAMAEGKKFGITDVEVLVSVEDSQKNAVENGEVSEVISGLKNTVLVALYAGNRKLSFSRQTLDQKELCDAMMQNMQVIGLVPENPNGGLLEKEKVYKGPLADLDVYDDQQPDQQTLIDYAKDVESAALAETGVKTTRTTSVSKGNGHVMLMATNGVDYHASKTSYSAQTEVIAEDAEGNMQVDGDYSVARHFSDMSRPRELGTSAGKNAVAKLGATMPASGTMPIILSHDAAEDFFSAVYAAINGTAVFRDSTFLKGKIGQQVMSKGVTLVDDPTIVRGYKSGQVDGTGQKKEKITFIEDGVLKGYNVSLQEARQLGIEPIGRDSPQPTNATILPGQQTPEQPISDIQDGIYIKGFEGGKVDVNNGVYSRQAYGTLIKAGKVTDIPVDGFVVSGNLKSMFMSVALANDTPPLPNPKYTLAAPTTRINGVVIAGR